MNSEKAMIWFCWFIRAGMFFLHEWNNYGNFLPGRVYSILPPVRNNCYGVYAEIYALDNNQIDPFLSVCDFPPFSAVLQIYADMFRLRIRGGAKIRDTPGSFFGY